MQVLRKLRLCKVSALNIPSDGIFTCELTQDGSNIDVDDLGNELLYSQPKCTRKKL